MKRKAVSLAAVIAAAALTAAACVVPEKTAETDEEMIAWVNEAETKDGGAASAAIKRIEKERREASIEESIKESASLQSSIDESVSVEESIAESIFESESWESLLQSIRESIANGGTPTGKMEKGRVVTIGDSEIPKIRRLFSDVIILGNSRARSILDSNVLTVNNVLFLWAAHMDEISDMVETAARLGRSKALFIMGVNDLGYYMANVAKWKADYIRMIELFRSINPEAEIYLQEIIPINENYRYRWHNMDRVTAYNEVLKEVAEETGTTVVSATDFAFPEFLSDDTGAHYDKRYHLYWAQTMANQMGLWDDHPEEWE